jgi:1,2-diacylglycerol 3-beta-galactosyltransferase
MGLPVIIERNAWTLPQERYNAGWVKEKGVGLVLSSFDTVVEAVTTLLNTDTFAKFQCNAKKMNNRALFEIPDILSHILQQTNS